MGSVLEQNRSHRRCRCQRSYRACHTLPCGGPYRLLHCLRPLRRPFECGRSSVPAGEPFRCGRTPRDATEMGPTTETTALKHWMMPTNEWKGDAEGAADQSGESIEPLTVRHLPRPRRARHRRSPRSPPPKHPRCRSWESSRPRREIHPRHFRP